MISLDQIGDAQEMCDLARSDRHHLLRISCVSRAYLVRISCVSRAYLGRISCVSRAYLGPHLSMDSFSCASAALSLPAFERRYRAV